MKYRKLGKTDLDVSVICLGTMTWGEQNTEAEGWEQMDYALSNGVNFFDTAELYSTPARAETYGSTERIIGSWLEARDLYQIHWPARSANFFGKRGYVHQEGWEDNFKMRLEVLHEQIEKGRIKYIGISNETPWGMMNYLSLAKQFDLPRIVSVQNPYNLLNREYETGLSEMSIREQCGLLAYSPLACGRLTNKYIDGTDTPECRLNKFKQYQRYESQNNQLAAQQYYDIAKSVGLSLAQLSLAWVNQQDFVTSNIIGATKMAQLKENIASIDITLSKEIVRKINKIQDLIPNPAT